LCAANGQKLLAANALIYFCDNAQGAHEENQCRLHLAKGNSNRSRRLPTNFPATCAANTSITSGQRSRYVDLEEQKTRLTASSGTAVSMALQWFISLAKERRPRCVGII
jgi:hypothetical protein